MPIDEDMVYNEYNNYYDADINESDIGNLGGHYLLVPQGSCHSRVMMINSESDWEQLRAFNKTKTFMHNSQIHSLLYCLSPTGSRTGASQAASSK